MNTSKKEKREPLAKLEGGKGVVEERDKILIHKIL